MATNLTSYKSIQSGLFVKIVCSYYKATPSATPSTETLLFSDLNRNITIGSDTYIGLGNFMAITSSSSELRVTSNDLTISLSGIPNSAIAEIINSRIKGSTVKVYRGLFNPTSNVLLSVTGNPFVRYSGIVVNYGINEEWDNNTRTSSNTLTLACASSLDVLNNTAKGRRTNPKDQKAFFSSDLSMDRIPALVRSKFNFGAPL